MIAIFIMSLPAVVNANFFELGGRNAWGISGDGSVVVGNGFSGQAFTWNEVDGLVDLGFLPGFDSGSRAYAASIDGSVVVGYSSKSGVGQQAFRWTEAGGMADLGTLGGTYTRARGVSSDGNVVVGVSYNDVGNTVQQAFRWTEAGGMVGLGDLPGGDVSSAALAVSGDGSVVVGASKSGSQFEAFRWTAADGMVGLGILPGAFDSFARGISADGSVIVGSSGGKAFRWTEADGMVALDFDSAYDVSSDGSVIVGRVRGVAPSGSTSDLAVRWTASGGTQTIRDWLGGAGITTNWRVLSYAGGVSDDGCSVAGYGANANASYVQLEGYLARVDTAGGCNTGVAAPDITVTDSVAPGDDLAIEFGNVTQATTSDETITITNDGNSDLAIGNIAALDVLVPPFSIPTDNCSSTTVAPAASCSLTIRFEPTGAGAFSDSFDIPSDDSDEASLTFNLTGTVSVPDKADQSITPIAANPATGVVERSSALSATASSGLTVSFGSSTPTVCTVTGVTVTYVTAGTCTVTANQAGDENYKAAPQVTLDITVGKADQTIIGLAADPASGVIGGTSTLSAGSGASSASVSHVTQSGQKRPTIKASSIPVTFGSNTLTICTVSGTTVSYLAVGTCTVTADQAGDANYNPAPQVTLDINVIEVIPNVPIPTLSLWGLVAMFLMMLGIGGMIVRRKTPG